MPSRSSSTPQRMEVFELSPQTLKSVEFCLCLATAGGHWWLTPSFLFVNVPHQICRIAVEKNPCKHNTNSHVVSDNNLLSKVPVCVVHFLLSKFAWKPPSHIFNYCPLCLQLWSQYLLTQIEPTNSCMRSTCRILMVVHRASFSFNKEATVNQRAKKNLAQHKSRTARGIVIVHPEESWRTYPKQLSKD